MHTSGYPRSGGGTRLEPAMPLAIKAETKKYKTISPMITDKTIINILVF